MKAVDDELSPKLENVLEEGANGRLCIFFDHLSGKLVKEITETHSADRQLEEDLLPRTSVKVVHQLVHVIVEIAPVSVRIVLVRSSGHEVGLLQSDRQATSRVMKLQWRWE